MREMSVGSQTNNNLFILSNSRLRLPMENPFGVKVGQVFTGFGVGCGVGIGIGRPLYLGAIPGLQPVLSATSGATDVLSGVGRHFNSSLRMLGMKRIEAGIGCGVGIGHGFGVGMALNPLVLHGIHTSFMESVIKIMKNMGIAPSLSSVKNIIPSSTQSGALTSNLQTFVGRSSDLSKTSQRTFQNSRTDGTIDSDIKSNTFGRKDTFSSTPLASRTEKVLNNFVQSPAFKNGSEGELDEVARHLRTENNVLQLLLKHQETIEKLVDENQQLHRILTEDLKVSPDKLKEINGSNTSLRYLCTDCFECRRRRKL